MFETIWAMIVVYCTKYKVKMLQENYNHTFLNLMWLKMVSDLITQLRFRIELFFFIVFKTKIRLNYVIPVRKQPHVHRWQTYAKRKVVIDLVIWNYEFLQKKNEFRILIISYKNWKMVNYSTKWTTSQNKIENNIAKLFDHHRDYVLYVIIFW